jgi:hypothetical protein
MSNRRMRVPPSGVLIKDPTSGAGPLEVGNGTPGRVYRAQGLRAAANVLFTGAAQLLPWQDPALPAGTGPAITQLDWLLPPNYLWEFELRVPIVVPAGGAAAGANLNVVMSARNVSTGLRENIWSPVAGETPGAITLYYPAVWSAPRYSLNPVPYDQLQLTIEAEAAFALFAFIPDQLSFKITQYSQGSL